MNDNNFQNFNSKGVYLLHFFSSLRPFCNEQTAVIDRLSEKLQARIRFANIDVEKRGELAIRLGIASLPTMIVFKDGREFRRFIGLQDASVLEKTLLKALGS